MKHFYFGIYKFPEACLSNRQPRLFIYCRKWQEQQQNKLHSRSWKQRMFDILTKWLKWLQTKSALLIPSVMCSLKTVTSFRAALDVPLKHSGALQMLLCCCIELSYKIHQPLCEWPDFKSVRFHHRPTQGELKRTTELNTVYHSTRDVPVSVDLLLDFGFRLCSRRQAQLFPCGSLLVHAFSVFSAKHFKIGRTRLDPCWFGSCCLEREAGKAKQSVDPHRAQLATTY